jgi:hypothetical protein
MFKLQLASRCLNVRVTQLAIGHDSRDRRGRLLYADMPTSNSYEQTCPLKVVSRARYHETVMLAKRMSN